MYIAPPFTLYILKDYLCAISKNSVDNFGEEDFNAF